MYHILFNEESGPVRECYIEAGSFGEAETAFIEAHPQAVYWEIGIGG